MVAPETEETIVAKPVEKPVSEPVATPAPKKAIANPNVLKDTTLKFDQVKKELDSKNKTWEELMEQVEELEAKLK